MADPDALEAPQQATAEWARIPSVPSPTRSWRTPGPSAGGLCEPNTVGSTGSCLLTYATPLHDQPVQDIRRQHVAAVIDQVARTAGTTSAMHTRAALSRFLRLVRRARPRRVQRRHRHRRLLHRQAQPRAQRWRARRDLGRDRGAARLQHDHPAAAVDRLQAIGGRWDALVGDGRRHLDVPGERDEEPQAAGAAVAAPGARGAQPVAAGARQATLFGRGANGFRDGSPPSAGSMPGSASLRIGICTTSGAACRPAWSGSASTGIWSTAS